MYKKINFSFRPIFRLYLEGGRNNFFLKFLQKSVDCDPNQRFFQKLLKKNQKKNFRNVYDFEKFNRKYLKNCEYKIANNFFGESILIDNCFYVKKFEGI